MDTLRDSSVAQPLLPISFTVARLPWRAFRDGQAASWNAVHPKWIYWITGGVSGLLSSAVNRMIDARFWYAYWIVLAAVLVFALIQSLVSNRARYRRCQSLYPATYTIDEAGVTSQNVSTATRCAWSAFESAVQTREALIVLFKTGEACVFPTEALPLDPAYYVTAINKRIAAA